MIIDTDKIQALLDDKRISYGRISEATGISKGPLFEYRSGKRDISIMSIDMAEKLQKLYDDIQKGDDNVDIKITGLKKAVGDYNNWQEQARIYFDIKDLEVWTNVYPGGNESWDKHHETNTVEVINKRGIVAKDNEYLSMRESKNICVNKLKEFA